MFCHVIQGIIFRYNMLHSRIYSFQAFEMDKIKNGVRNAKETKRIRVEDSIDGVCDSYDSKSSNSSFNTGFQSLKQEEMINISGGGLGNEKFCRSDQVVIDSFLFVIPLYTS